METHRDVVIIGGALAGGSMGLLLKRALPEASVLVVERRETFDFKVGESTSEVGAAFLTRILGLGSWLARKHIAKNGLRFWFQSPGNADPGACSELGPALQTRLPAFQIDRSRLDAHVREMAAAAGCEIVRPGTVRDLDLGGIGRNRVTISGPDGVRTVNAAWVVDASGKAACIARKNGTLEPLEEHPTSSMWCRFTGVRDLDDGSLAATDRAFGRRSLAARATATNHLTGYGWWSWIIPLQGGEVSVGITWDRRLFDPPAAGTVPDRILAVLEKHALGAWMMADARPVDRDARIYTQLAYRNTRTMGDGWVAVGDAAGFLDPLYSQGIDFLGNTVWAAHRIIVDSLRGGCVRDRIATYDAEFRRSFDRWFRALYLDKYRYLGDAELMRAALFLDIGCYFIGPVRLVCGDPETELTRFPYHGPYGTLFARFMAAYNRRLAVLAEKRRVKGIWGRRNVGHHHVFAESFTPSPAVRKKILQGLAIWLGCEVSTLMARTASGMPQPLPRSGREEDQTPSTGPAPAAEAGT